MKGIGERELEGRGRTSSYLELLSCNLLERRQERYKQKSQTDGFWLWGEGNIRYLLAKWQSVLIVHNTATTLPMECRLLNQRKERGERKKIPSFLPLHLLHTPFPPCTARQLVPPTFWEQPAWNLQPTVLCSTFTKSRKKDTIGKYENLDVKLGFYFLCNCFWPATPDTSYLMVFWPDNQKNGCWFKDIVDNWLVW